ncbi:MAG TPA: zinc ribbon domain-containing protein [Candidatus Egerieousia sp.]|nr:zinc ribbon domain-containing protein [Candidatus Egerieousia sp.]HPT05576.1 zinc ribbon domain-containing protein [Candidatus Egerieousia sp.]
MKRIYIIFAVVFLAFVLSACTGDHISGLNENEKFSLAEAKTNFEDNAQDLKLVEYFNSGSAAATKADFENITPDWENAIYGTTKNSSAYMVPLNVPANTVASFYAKTGIYYIIKKSNYDIKSYLVIERLDNGQVRRFITTAIGSMDNRYSDDKAFLYTGCRTHFNGFMLYSDETGKCVEAYYFGNSKKVMLGVIHDNNDMKNSTNRTATLIGFALHFPKIVTKSSTDSLQTNHPTGYITGEEGDSWYCYNCGVYVHGDICPNCKHGNSDANGGAFLMFCPDCGALVQDCNCGHFGGGGDHNYEPNSPCPYCGREDCTGQCQNDNNNNNKDSGNGEDKDSPNDNIDTYVYQDGDTFAINSYLTTAEHNGLNVSPFEAISYAYNTIRGSFYSYAYYLAAYCNAYNADAGEILASGIDVSNSNFINFLGNYFNLAPASSYKYAIDSGKIVFTTKCGSLLNSCIVIGYRSNNSILIYMDLMTGQLNTGTASLFNSSVFNTLSSK